MIIDTHAHLNIDEFKDTLNEVLEEFSDDNIENSNQKLSRLSV